MKYTSKGSLKNIRNIISGREGGKGCAWKIVKPAFSDAFSSQQIFPKTTKEISWVLESVFHILGADVLSNYP